MESLSFKILELKTLFLKDSKGLLIWGGDNVMVYREVLADETADLF